MKGTRRIADRPGGGGPSGGGQGSSGPLRAERAAKALPGRRVPGPVPRYRVGCTSFTYGDWFGPFYAEDTPKDQALRHYAKVFDLVEIDATFYRIPASEVVANWVAQTPDGFTITTKFSRRITHEARLKDVGETTAFYLERLAPLLKSGKAGPILAQFPPQFPRDKGLERLGPFLDLIPEGVRAACEFRHGSWFVPETYETLRKRNVAMVWQLDAEGFTPPELTADFLYCRLIGPERPFTKFDEVQRDLRPQMEALRERLEKHAQGAREVFLLCSNHFEGHAPGTAARLAEVLGLPERDLAQAKRGGEQRGLGDFGADLPEAG